MPTNRTEQNRTKLKLCVMLLFYVWLTGSRKTNQKNRKASYSLYLYGGHNLGVPFVIPLTMESPSSLDAITRTPVTVRDEERRIAPGETIPSTVTTISARRHLLLLLLFLLYFLEQHETKEPEEADDETCRTCPASMEALKRRSIHFPGRAMGLRLTAKGLNVEHPEMANILCCVRFLFEWRISTSNCFPPHRARLFLPHVAL